MRAFFVVVALAVPPALAGCAAVAGLDQYSKSSCADDCDGGTAADVTVDEGVDAIPDRGTFPDVVPDHAQPVESGADGGQGDAAPETGTDAKAAEAGTDAAQSEAGCGPTNTTSNCGACGTACMPAGATADTCNGLSCAYTCSSGHSDCNGATPPDTDGCECATAACCGASCQTIHANGVGQSYDDCNPEGTFTEVTATEACTAYALTVGGTAAACSGGWTCSGNTTQFVCYGTGKNFDTCADYCWMYDGTTPDGGPGAGLVIDCSCPGNLIGPWN